MSQTSLLTDGHETALCAWWLQQIGAPVQRFAALRPDFLIISPPKTGSTWLASNLRRHPQLFLPATKELKYFSSFFRSLDLRWYLDHFEAADGRVKGEASPCYALLPVQRIRLIRLLMPDVKLIFLMRAPVARAWSHAKHNHRYGEANFVSSTAELDSATDDQWRANFQHDWPLASGDYLGQLRRWLSVFPRPQMYVGFYESIARDPTALLRDVFAFLNVRADVDLSGFPITERILPGPVKDLPPALGSCLNRLLRGRTAELAAFLQNRFQLEPPQEWRTTPLPTEDSLSANLPAFRREWDDDYLTDVLDLEHTFRSSGAVIEENHLGHRIVLHRGRLYALAPSCSHLHPSEIGAAEIKRLHQAGECFIADALPVLKEQVSRRVNELRMARLEAVEANLLAAHERLSRQDEKLNATLNALRRLEGEALRLSPKEHAAVQTIRKSRWGLVHQWRRLLGSVARVLGTTHPSGKPAATSRP